MEGLEAFLAIIGGAAALFLLGKALLCLLFELIDSHLRARKVYKDLDELKTHDGWRKDTLYAHERVYLELDQRINALEGKKSARKN